MPTPGTNYFTPYTSTVDVALTDKAGLAKLIQCTAGNLPTDAGYAIGCIAIANDTGVLYTNTGTAVAATFTAVDSSTSLTLPSAFTDAATTTGASFQITENAITTGKAVKVINGNTTNFTTGAALFYGDMGAATAGNGLFITGSGAYTGTGLAVLNTGAMTTGIGLSVISTTGLTSGSLIRATSSTAGVLATNGAISLTATGAFTSNSAVDGGFVEIKANSTTAGTIVNIVGSALTTGIALQLSNGTSAITSGSLIRVTASGTGTLATNGIVSLRHAGVYLSTSNSGLLDVQASALVGAGTVVNFQSTAASQTATRVLNVVQSGATLTAYTGSIIAFTGGFSGSSSTGNILGITAVNTTAGDAILITNNALTVGAATMINLSHATSVLGAGTSMLRITSTGIDTGTTTGTLLDLAQTAAVGNVGVLLTDSSSDTAARTNIKINVTNAAAVGVIPLSIQNAAVTGSNSKFKKIALWGGVTMYVGIDAGGNDPNGQLTGVAGDVCWNGASNKPYYCTVSGTTWVTIV